MKSILYVGATLMIGASIYGFVDYKKTNHRKEFKNMYETAETKKPEISANKEKSHLFVQQEENKVLAKETIVKEEKALQEKNIKVSRSATKKKKLNYKLFSRAPLETRYINKEFKLEDLKVSEPGKIVQKDKKEQ